MSEGRLVAIDIGSDTIHMSVMQRQRGMFSSGDRSPRGFLPMVPPVGRP